MNNYTAISIGYCGKPYDGLSTSSSDFLLSFSVHLQHTSYSYLNLWPLPVIFHRNLWLRSWREVLIWDYWPHQSAQIFSPCLHTPLTPTVKAADPDPDPGSAEALFPLKGFSSMLSHHRVFLKGASLLSLYMTLSGIHLTKVIIP